MDMVEITVVVGLAGWLFYIYEVQQMYMGAQRAWSQCSGVREMGYHGTEQCTNEWCQYIKVAGMDDRAAIHERHSVASSS